MSTLGKYDFTFHSSLASLESNKMMIKIAASAYQIVLCQIIIKTFSSANQEAEKEVQRKMEGNSSIINFGRISLGSSFVEPNILFLHALSKITSRLWSVNQFMLEIGKIVKHMPVPLWSPSDTKRNNQSKRLEKRGKKHHIIGRKKEIK